jgi:hypothetical protein
MAVPSTIAMTTPRRRASKLIALNDFMCGNISPSDFRDRLSLYTDSRRISYRSSKKKIAQFWGRLQDFGIYPWGRPLASQ